MAFSIISSNRVETLQARLSRQLAAHPSGDPFVAEVIVVPTFAMSRWLNLRIAQQQGIAANIEYHQPGKWIWQLAASLIEDLPQRDPWSGENMAWQIFSLIPDLADRPAFTRIKAYLEEDLNGVKRWQLSQRIATSFDRYQWYRPEMILDWSSGGGEHWQAMLWREMTSRLNHPHRAQTLSQMLKILDSEPGQGALPQRVSLFATSNLAPVFIGAIQALAKHSDVFLYQHSPSAHYWADLKSEKALSRLRLENPAGAEYFESGNELLASWGRQGQVMQDLLLDAGASIGELDHRDSSAQDSLLLSIQKSIFELDDNRLRIDADDSLSLHVCHSPMRECQVLHDRLLALLEADPELSGEDILVMVPEINLYAPYIESVFQRDDSAQRPFLAWNISDVTVEDHHPLARSFLALIGLPDSRFGFSEIMAFLDVAEIRNQFGIAPDMLEAVYRIMEQAAVRWGLDSEHRQSFGLPANAGNTWQQAWDRLFAGYALADSLRWQQIAAIENIDNSSAVGIAQLRHFIDRLDYWRKELGRPGNARNWQTRLNQLIDEFFAGQDQEKLQSLRDCVDKLDPANATSLAPGLLGYWMEQQLATRELPGRLFSGGITFCGMRPMRNIPFPVICLLGMDNQTFPRRESQSNFDLMTKNWRPGDPLNRDEDRYLMLETLLCARQTLYISYCGRSLRDNSRREPSVLVRELLDFVDSKFEPVRGQPMSRAITWQHPMQAFASANFGEACASYDRYWFETAQGLNQNRGHTAPSSWPLQPLARSQDSHLEPVELDQLRRFYRHPVRYFYNTRLGISLPEMQTPEDEEPFQLEGLQKWEASQRLARAMIEGDPLDTETLLAEGLLPLGPAAESEVAGIRATNKNLFEALARFENLPAESMPVECHLANDCAVFGEVSAYYPGVGLMQFSSSKLKGKFLLPVWLDHLAICASKLLPEQECTRLIAANKSIVLTPVEGNLARQLLADYVAVFRIGALCPIPLFPDSSYAWSGETDTHAAMLAANKSWTRDSVSAPPGESEDAYNALALHNGILEPLRNPGFAEYSARIFAPLRQHMESE